MFGCGYYIYRLNEDGTIEWLRVKNCDEPITWQWELSVGNATVFDRVSEATNYARTFNNEKHGIIYLTPEITLTIEKL